MQANKFHIKAEELREQDKLEEALDVLDLALKDYEENQNYEGFVQVLQSRVLTYKHLFREKTPNFEFGDESDSSRGRGNRGLKSAENSFLLSKDKEFLELARSDAGRALDIAVQKSITSMLGSSYFHLGEISMLNKDFRGASDYYQQALDNFIGTECERGDYKYHLGEALYKLGQETKGLKLLEEGLTEIRKNRNQVDTFLADVWESGCLMKLAEVLKEIDSVKSKKYLEQAEKIIDSSKKLVIRKRQLKILEEKLSGRLLR